MNIESRSRPPKNQDPIDEQWFKTERNEYFYLHKDSSGEILGTDTFGRKDLCEEWLRAFGL
jgi:hypothetical protein